MTLPTLPQGPAHAGFTELCSKTMPAEFETDLRQAPTITGNYMHPVEQRFWSKVRVTPGCWLWSGSTTLKGYGRLSVAGGVQLAHRISFAFYNGPIPDQGYVLHKCDVPGCVNPDHLFLGTPHDNVLDCMAKGRRITMRGAAHGRAKLNETAVVIIRASPLPIRELANIFGVDPKVIANARDGTTWKHVNAKPAARCKLTEGQ